MRPSWTELFLNITRLVAQRSTCARLKVGAVLVKDNRIISIGYNGVPHGLEHCEDHFRKIYNNEVRIQDVSWEEYIASPFFMQEHHEFSTHNEIHAETNALMFAAYNGVSTRGADIYVSYTPCIHCSKQILQAGINHVYYDKPYDRDMTAINFLEKNDIACQQIGDDS